MGDRYDVERAIKRSGLPSPSRLILFVLLTHVTNGTLVVPSEYTPSLSLLAEETGLSRRAVADHLNRVEAEGWLKRLRPPVQKARTEKARTSYRITIPAALLASAPDALVQEVHQTPASAGGALAQKEPQVTTSAGDALVQEVHRASAGGAHNPTYSSSSPSEKKRQGGVGGRASRRKPETPAPEIFPVTASMRAWARDHERRITVDLDDQTERFLNHARQNDRRCRDWQAAWRNWILKAQDFADRDHARAATGTDGTYGHGPRARVNDHDWSQGGPTV
ncbi:hypothetical protein [Actinomadura sp. NPDC049753]|uniref:hypothetical protein n=1 Tax=Actinomadura sp. NPDC049753 TaxID=3154739 RepID=UPI00341DDF15